MFVAVPTGQPMQLALRAAPANVPTPQAVQLEDDGSDDVPAGQSVQAAADDAPVLALAVPLGHPMQLEAVAAPTVVP